MSVQRSKVLSMIVALQDGTGYSPAELHALTGMSESSVRLWIHAMRRAHFVYIIRREYDSKNIPRIKCYAWGSLPDARAPRKLSHAERTARHRAAKRRLREGRRLNALAYALAA